MRRHRQAMLDAQALHRLVRIAQGRAAGTEGDRDIVGRMRLETSDGRVELGALLVGLGREEFEADGGHGCGSRNDVPSIYLCIQMERWLTAIRRCASPRRHDGRISLDWRRVPAGHCFRMPRSLRALYRFVLEILFVPSAAVSRSSMASKFSAKLLKASDFAISAFVR